LKCQLPALGYFYDKSAAERNETHPCAVLLCSERSQNNDAWDASSFLQSGIAFPQITHTRKRKKLELKISPEEKVKRKSRSQIPNRKSKLFHGIAKRL
jgi:hypothetical protein